MPTLSTSDLIAIVAIAATIIVALIGFIGNYQIARVNSRLTAQNRDTDIVERFSNIYYRTGDQNGRRLSVHFINLIENPKTRYVMRQFIVWDALERNVTNGFQFDPERSDWHMFGDIFYDMAEDDYEKAHWFWCNLIKTTQERWPQHEVELTKLFKWTRASYQKAGSHWADCS